MKILDACCGSRMFWYDKHEPHTTYIDKRIKFEKLSTGHLIDVNPDVQADFKNLPFKDCEFDLVVFDPPHLIYAGKESWLAKKYGVLPANWEDELEAGFKECMRVLKPTGSLIFKWSDEQIKFGQVIKVLGQQPIFGDKRAKTKWSVFIKGGD
ncbi:class I SAM-dependent methyltransferase [Ligilactobacillus acidipiscis]|uniref:class I SAM-dependent methyltransferase n=2 Tax=Ligilactobacillus acidipiscis TaxID=89059 RepID=UPI0022E7D711|nr:class I SAM-dependent methyltransferase [Ligilactobacillus acidipiscis]